MFAEFTVTTNRKKKSISLHTNIGPWSSEQDVIIQHTYMYITWSTWHMYLFPLCFNHCTKLKRKKTLLLHFFVYISSSSDSKSTLRCRSYHSWWMYLILPVQRQGWKRGRPGVEPLRHTRQISPVDNAMHYMYIDSLGNQHMGLSRLA